METFGMLEKVFFGKLKMEAFGMLENRFFLENVQIDFFWNFGNQFFWKMEKWKIDEFWENVFFEN